MKEVSGVAERASLKFWHSARKYALFHVTFLFLFFVELFLLLIFFSFSPKTILLPTSIAITIVTIFSYFVLRFYFQAKKPQEFLTIQEELTQNFQDSPKELFLEIDQFLQRLQHQKKCYDQVPLLLQPLEPLIKKFNAWCHFTDVLFMQELLYSYKIQTQLKLIKKEPLDINLHRALAQTYISLYKIFHIPFHEKDRHPFLVQKLSSGEIKEKFLKSTACAIEELKIVLHYAQSDEEALMTLAHIYHDLNQKDEEKKTYKTLLEIGTSNEREVRLQLGILYFELGEVSQGLLIYDYLQKISDPKALELISFYDEFHQNL
jgi:tetratricopeptide (TPR) repeat protein